ncbi:MAG TPA: MFS transporter [Pseudonocardiaceae bacterium]|nr:MFS transporter [Pseudonocardiaceae bacterium]
MGWLSRVRMDVSPLRDSAEFRKLFASETITLLGSEITEVAVLVQLTRLTGSPLAVGLLGAVQVVPLVVFSLYGGLLADRLDRRVLAFGCEAALLLVTGSLLVNSLLPHPALWVLYVAAGLAVSLAALQRPSLDAAVPRLVGKEQFAASAALRSVGGNVSLIIGPAIGGALMAGPSPAWAYGIDAVTFVVSVAFLFALRPLPRSSDAEAASGLRGIGASLRFALGRRELLGSYLVDMAAMALAFPVALLPFMAIALHASWAQGLLFSASSVGALLASATSGWTGGVHRHGRAIVISAAGWGAAIVGFGLAPNLGVAIAFLVLSGGADMYSGIFRTTFWNSTIPDEMRGRMAGLEVISYGVGPVLGQIRGGATAGAFGVRFSLASGGIACVVVSGAICAALPRLWHFDQRIGVTPTGEQSSFAGKGN